MRNAQPTRKKINYLKRSVGSYNASDKNNCAHSIRNLKIADHGA